MNSIHAQPYDNVLSILERILHDPSFNFWDAHHPLAKRRRNLIKNFLRNYRGGGVSFAAQADPQDPMGLTDYFKFDGTTRPPNYAKAFDILSKLTSVMNIPVDSMFPGEKDTQSFSAQPWHSTSSVKLWDITRPLDTTDRLTDDGLVRKITFYALQPKSKKEAQNSGDNQADVFVRLKATPAPAKRNRLSRKFGSEQFLVVKYVMPAITLTDKVDMVHDSPLSPDDRKLVAALREANLFLPPKSCVSLPPLAIKDSISEGRKAHYDESSLVMKRFMEEIHIAGKTFRFLLTTTAGVHKQKYVFTSVPRERILQWAFSHADIEKLRLRPLKMALRLAQLNSITESTLFVPPERYSIAPDIVIGDGSTPELVLTDGCGRISLDCAKRLIAELRKRPCAPDMTSSKMKYENDGAFQHDIETAQPDYADIAGTPSAFQIRFGGLKGMLVVDPELRDWDIVFSKSMLKFETPEGGPPEHQTVDVVGVSWKGCSVHFNSEILDLLGGRTTDPTQLFRYCQQLASSHLSSHNFLLENADQAMEFYYKTKDHIAFQMILGGFPLKLAYLVGFFRTTVLPLRFDIKDAARLYGVPDFTRKLLPNQVFLGGCAYRGPVLVLKEPCFLPSDVRCFEAVHMPGWDHLQHVIVFSAHETLKTSEASKIAGSDYDGDKFVVIWDAELIRLFSQLHQVPQPAFGAKPSTSDRATSPQNLLAYQEVGSDQSASEPEPSASDSAASPQNKLTSQDVDAIFSDMQRKATSAVHNRKRASLPDLLRLRLCFIDRFGGDWVTNPFCLELGHHLTSTIDAPKNGSWVPIDQTEELLANCPQFPLFHSRARKVNTRANSSLRAKLWSFCMGKVATSVALHWSPSSPTLQDHKDMFEVWLGSHSFSSGHPASDRLIANRVASLLSEEARGVLRRQMLMEHVAFFSTYWKFLVPFDDSKYSDSDDNGDPLDSEADELYEDAAFESPEDASPNEIDRENVEDAFEKRPTLLVQHWRKWTPTTGWRSLVGNHLGGVKPSVGFQESDTSSVIVDTNIRSLLLPIERGIPESDLQEVWDEFTSGENFTDLVSYIRQILVWKDFEVLDQNAFIKATYLRRIQDMIYLPVQHPRQPLGLSGHHKHESISPSFAKIFVAYQRASPEMTVQKWSLLQDDFAALVEQFKPLPSVEEFNRELQAVWERSPWQTVRPLDAATALAWLALGYGVHFSDLAAIDAPLLPSQVPLAFDTFYCVFRPVTAPTPDDISLIELKKESLSESESSVDDPYPDPWLHCYYAYEYGNTDDDEDAGRQPRKRKRDWDDFFG
eukprot:TRINITY_DN13519_c0_g1_i1.p1 TRINITY_DN13519_c0_g1~~TRINITY_DN13519_c0_g1_i1.p1  ORF type:complete len:1296 (+),score=170.22 TRINITY_DN13519_c0_g1_i1:302-4189(+)